MRPACCRRRSPAKAEVRLNGSRRDDQRPHRHARRRRVQRLGLGRYREQAAGEARSRFPAARMSRGADRGRRRGAGLAARGAMRPIDLNGPELCRRPGAGSPPPSSISATARFAPAAIEATLAGGVLKAAHRQSRRLWRPGQRRTHRRCLGRRARLTRCAPTSPASARCRCCRALADFDKLDGKMQAKIAVRSHRHQPARDHVEHAAAPRSPFSRTAPSAASMSRR